MLGAKRHKVIAIMGPTGIGKTTIANALCNRLNGELLSLDSVKVHKRLTIGAHKVYDPRNPVHLFDLVEPHEPFSAQEYLDAATEAVEGVLARGRTPIFFGGATMYAEWVFFGGGRNGAIDRARAEEVEAELRGYNNWDAAMEVAMALDPRGASRITRNDYYRLTRLVTAARDSTKPFTVAAGYKKPRLAMDLRGAFLCVPDRGVLYRTLDRRCEKMVADGLLEETLALMHMYDGQLPRKIATVVGYRQCYDFVQSNRQNITYSAFGSFMDKFQAATRDYARRQLAYFRNSPELSSSFCTVECLPNEDSVKLVVGAVERLYGLSREEYEAEVARSPRVRKTENDKSQGGMRTYMARQDVFDKASAVDLLVDRFMQSRMSLEMAGNKF